MERHNHTHQITPGTKNKSADKTSFIYLAWPALPEHRSKRNNYNKAAQPPQGDDACKHTNSIACKHQTTGPKHPPHSKPAFPYIERPDYPVHLPRCPAQTIEQAL